jgi:putative ABC transport system substrate-binding protein
MKTHLCSILIAPIILMVAYFAEAQQTRVYRVGILMHNSPERPHIHGFRIGMEKAGYIKGKNLVLNIEQRNDVEELRAAAKLFVDEKFDVIVASSNIETAIAQQATPTIPIVFLPASAPVRAGFVRSLARPGTNLTGVTYYIDFRQNGKQIEMFKEVVPRLGRLVSLVDESVEQPVDHPSLELLRKVAAHMRIKLTEKPVDSLSQAETFVSSLSRQTTDGIHVTCTGLFSNLRSIGRISLERKLPLYGCSRIHVEQNGALFTYAPDMYQMGLRAAWYVDRILKGSKPQEMPVEAPRKYELAINVNVASLIGLTIPPRVLQRADIIIR